MKINNKEFPNIVVDRILIFVFSGETTYDEIVEWGRKFYPDLEITPSDIDTVKENHLTKKEKQIII